MVRPHLEYGNAIWGPFYQSDIATIESVQRRATKLIPELRDLSYKERLMNLKLPLLTYRRKRGDMILIFKIMNGAVRLDANKLFTHVSNKTRGHTKKVYKTPATKTVRINTFSQRVIDNWNSLPQSVVDAPSINAFKNRLDKHWEDHHYNY